MADLGLGKMWKDMPLIARWFDEIAHTPRSSRPTTSDRSSASASRT